MARTAEPVQLRLLKGRGNGTDSGGRKLPEPLGVERKAPTAPPGLSLEAKKEWKRVVPLLKAQECIKELDRATLATYCESWAEWVAANAELQTHGRLTIEAAQGEIPHPAVRIRREAAREIRALSALFGLSPAHEQVLAGGKGKSDDDESSPFG